MVTSRAKYESSLNISPLYINWRTLIFWVLSLYGLLSLLIGGLFSILINNGCNACNLVRWVCQSLSRCSDRDGQDWSSLDFSFYAGKVSFHTAPTHKFVAPLSACTRWCFGFNYCNECILDILLDFAGHDFINWCRYGLSWVVSHSHSCRLPTLYITSFSNLSTFVTLSLK